MLRPTLRHPLATAAVVALLGVCGGATALATTTGQNGEIAFRRYLGPDRSKGAIFTIAPDGSGERQLTSPPAGAATITPTTRRTAASSPSSAAPRLPAASPSRRTART